MERVNLILKNSKYIEYMETISNLERDRIYCRHNISHSLDVARIAMLIAMEEGVEVSREVVYGAALMHDVGRAAAGDHRKNSAKMAENILNECGFSKEERNIIEEMILCHGNKGIDGEKSLRGIFYRADKLSRPCYMCQAKQSCYWSDESKNLSIRI